MKTKFTQGPWYLSAGRNIETQSGTFYLSYGYESGSNMPMFRNFVELDNNARLIAEAPKMHELLVDCEKNMIISTKEDMERLDRIRETLERVEGRP